MQNTHVMRRLVAILGKRAFFSFGLVTFLIAALLAATNITSRYALKRYVEDQLSRTPWDLAVYDEGTGSDPALASQMRSVEGIQKVESLVFLRADFNNDVQTLVDGKPMVTPWLCLLSASEPSLLPPQLRMAMAYHGASGAGNSPGEKGAILALVGPERGAMAQAFTALEGARDFAVKVQVNNQSKDLFSTPLHGVIHLEADQLNRWYMDETGSVTMVPSVATVLLMPYSKEVISRFNDVAMGQVPPQVMGPSNLNYGHVAEAEYLPEVIYLGRVDRQRLISGWDLGRSYQRLSLLKEKAQNRVHAIGSSAVVDSTTLVLLGSMNRVARLIGILTVLIALPLLWMAWVMAASLSGLLILNERRKLGLMRLRGVPGHLMGRAFLLAISAGGLLGGILGLLVGSLLPLLIYQGGHLPLSVFAVGHQILLLVAFLVITLAMALLVSRRLIRYVTQISPLEASRRVAVSEAAQAEVRFGPIQAISLILGAYTLLGWVFNFSLSSQWPTATFQYFDHILDFIGLPLFIYGIACLLVFRRSWIHRILTPLVRPLGGRMGTFALRQIELKPHRTATFLLIVLLMVSICLYPAVTNPSFVNKIVRGAKIETGAEWQISFNAPDLLPPGQELGKSLGGQLEALRPGIEKITSALRKVPGVLSVSVISEAILPNFYLPGYGFSGVPLYLLNNPDSYLRNVYSEPELGIGNSFKNVILRLKSGDVVASPEVASFWELSAGKEVPLGMDAQYRTITADVGGITAFLPGMPQEAVTDRQGYVQARIDYLNYLFKTNAYLVASANNASLADMQVLVSSVTALVQSAPGTPIPGFQNKLLRALPVAPLGVHSLPEEIQRVGSDMYIFLALANMRLYLAGGFVLALISILAIALANYAEDRRTLALVRIRGASPAHIRRFLIAMLLAPAILGVIVGGLVALFAGYGLSNYVWKLREIKSIVEVLPTHLVISTLTVGVAIGILVFLIVVILSFSQWIFRRTARENIQEG